MLFEEQAAQTVFAQCRADLQVSNSDGGGHTAPGELSLKPERGVGVLLFRPVSTCLSLLHPRLSHGNTKTFILKGIKEWLCACFSGVRNGLGSMD